MPRVGLVLGAGGASGGAFHAGVLAALAESTGWDPRTADIIVGTSAGSIAATMLGVGLPAPDLVARMQARPLSAEGTALLGDMAMVQPPPLGAQPRTGPMRFAAAPTALLRAARRPWAVRPGAVLAAMVPPGTLGTEVIGRMVRALAGEHWPDRKLWLCAVRLSSGERVVLRRDGTPPASLADAVAASCAIPGFFQPVRIDGHDYVDGGVHSPTNLDLVAGKRLDLVVVSSPMSSAGRGVRLAPDLPMRTFARALLAAEVHTLRRQGTEVFVFQPTHEDQSVMGLNAMDGSRRGTIAGHVRESALRWLGRPETARRLARLHEEG